MSNYKLKNKTRNKPQTKKIKNKSIKSKRHNKQTCTHLHAPVFLILLDNVLTMLCAIVDLDACITQPIGHGSALVQRTPAHNPALVHVGLVEPRVQQRRRRQARVLHVHAHLDVVFEHDHGQVVELIHRIEARMHSDASYTTHLTTPRIT